ncbi:MAG: hypothetical protein NT154_06930 [Verrucomicrobia bacterium]|nr:hypothetical protein [Verrucomicrobiota bacterium]
MEEVLNVVLVLDLEGLTFGVPGEKLVSALVEVPADTRPSGLVPIAVTGNVQQGAITISRKNGEQENINWGYAPGEFEKEHKASEIYPFAHPQLKPRLYIGYNALGTALALANAAAAELAKPIVIAPVVKPKLDKKPVKGEKPYDLHHVYTERQVTTEWVQFTFMGEYKKHIPYFGESVTVPKISITGAMAYSNHTQRPSDLVQLPDFPMMGEIIAGRLVQLAPGQTIWLVTAPAPLGGIMAVILDDEAIAKVRKDLNGILSAKFSGPRLAEWVKKQEVVTASLAFNTSINQAPKLPVPPKTAPGDGPRKAAPAPTPPAAGPTSPGDLS